VSSDVLGRVPMGLRQAGLGYSGLSLPTKPEISTLILVRSTMGVPVEFAGQLYLESTFNMMMRPDDNRWEKYQRTQA